AKGSQPRGRMIAQLLGPLPNGPEVDTQPSGDLGMSQATGSEQPSTLQPTFFNLALSKFARVQQFPLNLSCERKTICNMLFGNWLWQQTRSSHCTLSMLLVL